MDPSQLAAALLAEKQEHEATKARLEESLEANHKFMDTTAKYANTFRLVRSLMIEKGILSMPEHKKYLAPAMLPSESSNVLVKYVVADSLEALDRKIQAVGGQLVPNTKPILAESEQEATQVQKCIAARGNALLKQRRREMETSDAFTAHGFCLQATSNHGFLTLFQDAFSTEEDVELLLSRLHSDTDALEKLSIEYEQWL